MSLLLASILLSIVTTMFSVQTEKSKIEKNGMSVEWYHKADRVYFEVQAPTDGWVAIGFNNKDRLTGNNLIMGAVKDNKVEMTDGYIVGVGNHQVMEKIGGSNQLQDIEGRESMGKTTVAFSLPVKAADQFHFDLDQGKTYFLLIAYSRADDFEHHSTMRTSVSINL